jgi:hypothetical protein
MKKLNNKGFGHIEIFIVIVAFAVIVMVGGFVWQNSKSKDSSAQSRPHKNWTVRTVYCSYTNCYLNSGKGKAPRSRWVNAVGIGFNGACSQTGIEYWAYYPAAEKLGDNHWGWCLLR